MDLKKRYKEFVNSQNRNFKRQITIIKNNRIIDDTTQVDIRFQPNAEDKIKALRLDDDTKNMGETTSNMDQDIFEIKGFGKPPPLGSIED